MVAAGDLRKGTKILYKEEPYTVLDYQHVKPGKGGAYIRTKLKNLITGSVVQDTFRSDQKIETPDLEYKEMLFIYKEGDAYEFLDKETYEQVSLTKDQLEDVLNFLKEQTVYSILYFEGRPVAVSAPLFLELEVKETVPGVKGDTAQGGSKPATLETGLTLQVPLFVNEGDFIKIDTRTSEYIERVKK